MVTTASVRDPATGKYIPFNAWKKKYDLKTKKGLGRAIRLSWREEKHIRQVKELGARCMRCGYGEFLECLDLHHIIAKKKGGKDTIDNLLLLCCNCHFAFHRGRVTLEELGKLKKEWVGFDESMLTKIKNQRYPEQI